MPKLLQQIAGLVNWGMSVVNAFGGHLLPFLFMGYNPGAFQRRGSANSEVSLAWFCLSKCGQQLVRLSAAPKEHFHVSLRHLRHLTWWKASCSSQHRQRCPLPYHHIRCRHAARLKGSVCSFHAQCGVVHFSDVASFVHVPSLEKLPLMRSSFCGKHTCLYLSCTCNKESGSRRPLARRADACAECLGRRFLHRLVGNSSGTPSRVS